MGAMVEQGGARGRRSLDAAVNLVPYVDILMTLMVFLVMCAVFTQLAALTVHGKSAGDGAPPVEPSAPPLSLLVTARGVSVERDGKRVEVAREPAAIERAIRDVVPSPIDDTVCTLRSDDGVSYGDLVEIIDVTRRIGITNVSLEPAAS
jgi:biopolymer transport protein TolR